MKEGNGKGRPPLRLVRPERSVPKESSVIQELRENGKWAIMERVWNLQERMADLRVEMFPSTGAESMSDAQSDWSYEMRKLQLEWGAEVLTAAKITTEEWKVYMESQ
jgi:hypothetical protein